MEADSHSQHSYIEHAFINSLIITISLKASEVSCG